LNDYIFEPPGGIMPQKLTKFTVKKVSLVSQGANDEEFQKIQKAAETPITLFKSTKEIDKMKKGVKKAEGEEPKKIEAGCPEVEKEEMSEEEKKKLLENLNKEEEEKKKEEAEVEKEDDEEEKEVEKEDAPKTPEELEAEEKKKKEEEEEEEEASVEKSVGKVVELQKALQAKDAELQAIFASVESIRKNAENQAKVAKEATLRLAKLEDVAKTAAITSEVKATMSGILGATTEQLTSVLKAAGERKLSSEEVAIIRKAFVATSAVIVKSAAFGEIGTSKEVKIASPLDQANAYAEAQVSKSGSTNPDQKASARAEFWENNPDVYKAYLRGGN
jgi:hypothetical protein